MTGPPRHPPEEPTLATAPHHADDSVRLRRHQAAMLASVSHDLRTPLTVLTATSETLLEHVEDPFSRTLLEAQERAVQRLTFLVEEILSVTTALADDSRRDDQAVVVLEEVLRDAAATLGPDGGPLPLDVHVAPAASAVRSVPSLLRMLLRCVLEDRALSGRGKTVEAVAWIEDGDLHLTLASTAPLDPGGDTAFHPNGGMGLTVVAATLLAERLGGTLELDDRAVATLRLPQRRAEDPIAHELSD